MVLKNRLKVNIKMFFDGVILREQFWSSNFTANADLDKTSGKFQIKKV